jgi:hypothetical protein
MFVMEDGRLARPVKLLVRRVGLRGGAGLQACIDLLLCLKVGSFGFADD